MTQLQQLKDEIMAEVIGSEHMSIRPEEAEIGASTKLDVPMPTVREAVYDLVENGDLIFAYHDPYHYLETPIVKSHHAARPMKCISDTHGDFWICDAGVDPSADLEKQGCWRCGDQPFTRND